ncbi:MAG: hypothetical protein ACK5NL_18665, partial [Vibrio fluvialis]
MPNHGKAPTVALYFYTPSSSHLLPMHLIEIRNGLEFSPRKTILSLIRFTTFHLKLLSRRKRFPHQFHPYDEGFMLPD